MKPKSEAAVGAKELVAMWTLPHAATLGSSVRSRAFSLRLVPVSPRRLGDGSRFRKGGFILRMPRDTDDEFRAASSVIAKALEGIEGLPVIPREIEDILSISTSERRRWLKDGRLPSAGTRTVKLRGRAKEITFHVFDPRQVEDVLDRELVATWREEDAEAAAEKRRKTPWKRKLTRSPKQSTAMRDPDDLPNLSGWEEFAREGLLR
jgi:hypothetical protein